MRANSVIFLVTLGAIAVPASRAASQTPESQPQVYTEALVRLEIGDTSAALHYLREATRAHPDFGPAYLRLGSILRKQSDDPETAADLIREAELALKRAWDLMGDDPEVMVELGLLLRLEQDDGEAQRMFDRAWAEAEQRARRTRAEEAAEMYYELGTIYERWWEDWDRLVMIPPTAEVIYCNALLDNPASDHASRSVLCPREWAIQLPEVVPVADMKADDRERMYEHFRLAIASDPSHVEAAVSLLGHLAADEHWTEYMAVAQELAAEAPGDPRAQLFLGLGLHGVGSDRAAATVFDSAIALLSAEDRVVFDDVTPLLTRRGRAAYADLDSAGRAVASTAFFVSTDPLFLTEANERRIEHYSRLAWAELKYASPAMDLRGWQSERGLIWVRYGKPWQSYQCCYGGGGRMDYWSYGPYGPVFVFARQLRYRHARHYGFSKAVEEQLAIDAPQAYQPAAITAVYDIPLQLARFRGDGYDLTRVEIYAAVPLDSLGIDVGASLETGLFVFTRDYLDELLARRLSAVADQPRMGLTYGFQVPVGLYSFGVEAREEGPESFARPAARARDTLAVPGFPEGRLAISDLLLADGLRALSERPRVREELRIWPSRTLLFVSGDPVHVYFEVYGLATDADGLARYRVELAVEDVENRNVVEKIARGLVELFSRGDAQEPAVAWERTVVVEGDRSMEYVSVSLPPLDEGPYRVVVRIEDLTSGVSTLSERAFWIDSLD